MSGECWVVLPLFKNPCGQAFKGSGSSWGKPHVVNVHRLVVFSPLLWSFCQDGSLAYLAQEPFTV